MGSIIEPPTTPRSVDRSQVNKQSTEPALASPLELKA